VKAKVFVQFVLAGNFFFDFANACLCFSIRLIYVINYFLWSRAIELFYLV